MQKPDIVEQNPYVQPYSAHMTRFSGFASMVFMIVAVETEYEQAKAKALAQLRSPFHVGGEKMADRESLHDRQSLR